MDINNKITLVISSLSGGGAERVCVSLANSFVKNGWRVDLVILNLNKETFVNHLLDKVNLIVLNVNHARYAAIPLLKYIFKKKPKKLIVFNYELSVMLVILRLIFRFNLKIIARNINTYSIKLKKFRQKGLWNKHVVLPLIKIFYKKVDYVINQCNAMRDDLISEQKYFIDNSNVIYNPIPSNIENFIKNNDFSKIEKKNYLLCVGRLEKQKAFKYAIEAFAGILVKFPNLRLKIVGQGTLKQELKQKAIELNIEDKIDFEGFQKDLIPYYLYSKCTLLTSVYEGYPNVLIESISMNTPVVAFNCPNGPNEIIKNGINGYLVDQFDVKDLTEKTLLLLQNKLDYKDLKNSIISNNSKYIFKQYENIVNSLD